MIDTLNNLFNICDYERYNIRIFDSRAQRENWAIEIQIESLLLAERDKFINK